MEGLTIGELASGAGVKVATVRYYERRGLLPEPPRGPNGYRRYSSGDAARVRFIRRAQGFGFTLAEIAELLDAAGSGPPEDVRLRAEAKLTEIRAEAARLDAVRRRLEQLVSVCADGEEEECLALLPRETTEGGSQR